MVRYAVYVHKGIKLYIISFNPSYVHNAEVVHTIELNYTSSGHHQALYMNKFYDFRANWPEHVYIRSYMYLAYVYLVYRITRFFRWEFIFALFASDVEPVKIVKY